MAESGNFDLRFMEMEDDDIDEFMVNQENNSTKIKTRQHVGLFRAFLEQRRGIDMPIHRLPAEELNVHIANFIVSVRKKNGKEYEPSSLRGIFSSLDRHLRRNKYGFSLMDDLQFARSREALKAKQKNLKAKGLGNKPNKADPLTDQDMEILVDLGQLGTDMPSAIINTLWLFNTLIFGMRCRNKHREMCWGVEQ